MTGQQYTVIADQERGDRIGPGMIEPHDRVTYVTDGDKVLEHLVRIERPVPTTDEPTERERYDRYLEEYPVDAGAPLPLSEWRATWDAHLERRRQARLLDGRHRREAIASMLLNWQYNGDLTVRAAPLPVLLARTPTVADRMIPVPASLIDVATGKTAHRFNGECPDGVEGWDVRDDECDACKIIVAAEHALLSQPTPTAEPDDVELCDCGEPAAVCATKRAIPTTSPSIEDMAPGTTFTAVFHGEQDRFFRCRDSLARAGRYLVSMDAIDPSTIRDVTPAPSTAEGGR